MPYKPNKPCGHLGCGKLVPYGTMYCDKHRPLHPKEEVPRSADSRGYTKKWRKAREAYLAAHPLCVECAKEGRYVKADVVDHIIPHRGDTTLFWDKNNWQSLCKHHHDVKTKTIDREYIENHPWKGRP